MTQERRSAQRGTGMSDIDWQRELAKIEKQLESTSDEALFPSSKAGSPEERAAIVAKQQGTSTLAVLSRLALAVLLGVGVVFWPYDTRCGVGLWIYLFAVGVVAVSGLWSAIWSWRHRSARAHTLSLLVLAWGLILAAMEVLPRIGYAQDDLRPVGSWTCSQ